MSRQVYVAAVSNADIDAVRAALAEIGGNYAAYLFRYELIFDDDEDDAPTRAWGAETPLDFTERELALVKQAIASVAPASLKWREVPMKLLATDGLSEQDRLDMWLATNEWRCRGYLMPSIGTALADGTADVQWTNPSPTAVQQWTTIHKLIRMSHSGGFAFSDFPAGTYEFEIGNKYGGPLMFEPVEGITFGFRAAVHNTVQWQQVGAEVTSDDGTVRGMISGALDVGYKVALSVRSSEPAEFKLSAGSGMELRRVAK